ncbi:MAG: hypothetical protein HUK19_07405 [Fibrobacter sp.]|nr:hypothetical protein [Fibrobacter sp.]
MNRPVFVILVLLYCTASSFAFNGRCGTEMMMQYHRELRANPALTSRTVATELDSCDPEDYYDSVYSKTTSHFQIFYTLAGPHKTTKAFIDSLAVYSEFAYNFHTKDFGMQPPLGQSKTVHFLQDVQEGLYPIEVIDIDNLRNTRFWLGGVCHGCFGVTIPHKTETGASELLIDNDFRYTPTAAMKSKDSVNFDGKVCKYTIASEELRNTRYNYSYADQWDKALRVTTVHELYHAVQIRYLDLNKYYSFWFEASASGVEEIVAPDIDDYHSYLPGMFQMMGIPLNISETAASPTPYANTMYGSGIFLMYLYKFVDKKTDRFIWESFSKKPNYNFKQHFNSFAENKNFSADSLFNDFATRLALSGKRTAYLDYAQWITDDQCFWPNFNYFENKSSDFFSPQTKKFAYEYYANGKPKVNDYKGKVSAILFKDKSAEFSNLVSIFSVDSLYINATEDPTVDSLVWIFSWFDSDSFYPANTKKEPLHAYPMPWRSGSLCFTPLPENKNFIEIRNRRGDLITRINYSGSIHCMDEEKVKELMVPGVYRFRAGSSGKTQDFIVIY